jgi:uncharacterized protein (DUF433 family)
MPDTFRTGKAYTVAQVARLARTSPQNVSRWLRGYSATGHQMAPVFGKGVEADNGSPLTVSFVQLVEIIVVARFRQPELSGGRPIPLDRLRRAHEFARTRLGVEYPFATLELKAEGGHLLHEFDVENPEHGPLALDMYGQWMLPLSVHSALEQFDYGEDRLVERWFPLGHSTPIVVDPHLAGGKPVILGTRVPVDVILSRFKAGEDIKSIADDFEVEADTVEHALRYAAA